MYLAKKALFYPKKRLVKTLIVVDEEKDEQKAKKDAKLNVKQKAEENAKEEIINFNRPLKLKEYLDELSEIHYISYVNYYSATFIDMNNLYLSNLDLQRSILFKLVKLNLISVDDRNNILRKLYKNINFLNPLDFKTFMENVKQYYLENFKRLRYLL